MLNYDYGFTLTRIPDLGNDPTNFQKKISYNFRKLRRWLGMVPHVAGKIDDNCNPIPMAQPTSIEGRHDALSLKKILRYYGTRLRERLRRSLTQ